MRAVRAGPVLSGQHLSNEQVLRAALSGPVKGQCRLVCREDFIVFFCQIRCCSTALYNVMKQIQWLYEIS